MDCAICSFVLRFAIKSLIPTLYALVFMYSVTMSCRLSIKSDAAMLPKSLQVRVMRPLLPPPSTSLSSCPRKYLPSTISSTPGDVAKSSFSPKPLVLYFIVNDGMICDRIWKLVMRSVCPANSPSLMPPYAMSRFMASRGANDTPGRVKR